MFSRRILCLDCGFTPELDEKRTLAYWRELYSKTCPRCGALLVTPIRDSEKTLPKVRRGSSSVY